MATKNARRSTASASGPITGNQLYQQRARAALPLLVRQAHAGKPIFYSDLAEELGMANARNLNFVLGSIGQSMELLSKSWGEKVPPIQCVVVNRATGLPGEGIGSFLIAKEDFSKLPTRRKREIVDIELQQIYLYRRWMEVLKALSLKPVQEDFEPLLSKAERLKGGGEGEKHRLLKEFVAANPWAIGLRANTPRGETEHALPSGDSLDVSFRYGRSWVAAEVKSAISDEADIIRGLFQCVKYRAVMEAVQAAEARSVGARAILVLESSLPRSLVSLRNVLGIEVLERVTPRA